MLDIIDELITFHDLCLTGQIYVFEFAALAEYYKRVKRQICAEKFTEPFYVYVVLYDRVQEALLLRMFSPSWQDLIPEAVVLRAKYPAAIVF